MLDGVIKVEFVYLLFEKNHEEKLGKLQKLFSILILKFILKLIREWRKKSRNFRGLCTSLRCIIQFDVIPVLIKH